VAKRPTSDNQSQRSPGESGGAPGWVLLSLQKPYVLQTNSLFYQFFWFSKNHIGTPTKLFFIVTPKSAGFLKILSGRQSHFFYRDAKAPRFSKNLIGTPKSFFYSDAKVPQFSKNIIGTPKSLFL